MSFAEHGGAQWATGGSGGGSEGSDDTHEASRAVFQMTTKVAAFRRGVDAIGGKHDTPESRAKLHETRDAIASLAKTASNAVKRLSTQSSSSEAAQAQHAKLARDLQAVLSDFQRAQRICAERERMYSPQPASAAATQRAASERHEADAGGVEMEEQNVSASIRSNLHQLHATSTMDTEEKEEEQQRALLRRQRQQREKDLEAELEYNTAVIDERERGITDIQAQISEVHDIFQDLASLTSSQGAQIDDLEANISSTNARARDAQRELTQADKQQRTSRRRNLCFLLAAIVLASAVIAIVVAAATT